MKCKLNIISTTARPIPNPQDKDMRRRCYIQMYPIKNQQQSKKYHLELDSFHPIDHPLFCHISPVNLLASISNLSKIPSVYKEWFYDSFFPIRATSATAVDAAVVTIKILLDYMTYMAPAVLLALLSNTDIQSRLGTK